MRVVDANVLIYAVNEDAPRHGLARQWLDDALRGPESIGFAWVVLLAFIRLTTRQGLFPRPLAVADSLRVVRHWLAQPAAVVVHPTPRHADVLAGLLNQSGAAANLVTDAHLASLALEHGAHLVSFDDDFRRFADLTWYPPTDPRST